MGRDAWRACGCRRERAFLPRHEIQRDAAFRLDGFAVQKRGLVGPRLHRRHGGIPQERMARHYFGVDGKVKDVKVVSGHPLLRNTAVAAVKTWTYKPTLLDGKPVESESRISLNFVPR